MSLFLLYLIKSTLCLALFSLFYMLVLRGSTLFRFNRLTLLVGVTVCLLIPFVPLETEKEQLIQRPMLALDEWLGTDGAQSLLAGGESQWERTSSETEKPGSRWLATMLIAIYLLGAVAALLSVLLSYFRMGRLIRSSDYRQENGYRLIHTDAAIASFSWRNYIVINAADEESRSAILLHEQMHIRHRHSLDIFFMIFVRTLHWFNPAVWFLWRELRDLHEYEADESVLHQGIDATQYQLLLVKKAVGTRLYSMANGFNHRVLKKRITMMLKQRTNRWVRLRLLLAVPVAAGTLYAFARPEVKENLETVVAVVQQSEPETLEQLKAYFNEKTNAYEKSIARPDGSVVVKEAQARMFRVNKKNVILMDSEYIRDASQVRPMVADYLRKVRAQREKKTGKIEPQALIVQYDIGTDIDTLCLYLKDIKLAFEDIRKDYGNREDLDVVCPVWVSFLDPRDYGTPTWSEVIRKVELTFLDDNNKPLKSFKNFKLRDLATYLDQTKKEPMGVVSLKVDKDCRMETINKIKQMLRESNRLKMNYEAVK